MFLIVAILGTAMFVWQAASQQQIRPKWLRIAYLVLHVLPGTLFATAAWYHTGALAVVFFVAAIGSLFAIALVDMLLRRAGMS